MKKSLNIIIVSMLILSFSANPVAFSAYSDVIAIKGSLELIQEGSVPVSKPTEKESVLKSQAFFYKSNPASDAILNGLLNADPQIDLSNFSLKSSELTALMQNIINSSPELFYVDNKYGVMYSQTSEYVVLLEPQYTMSGVELETAKEEYRKELNKMISGVHSEWSDVEKCLYIHDYICANYKYDSSLTIFDAYNLFIKGAGVCQAYTLAYIAALKELNINVSYVSSLKMKHIWNIVNLENEWYHIDLTWDDTGNKIVCGQVKHTNFLQSDYGIESTGHQSFSPSEQSIKCNSNKYDTYFWNEVIHPFVWTENNCYCIISGCCYNAELTTGNMRFSGIDTECNYSSLASYNNNLCYNAANKIIVCDESGNQKYTLIESDNNIYGIYSAGDILKYAESTEFNQSLEFNNSIAFLYPSFFSVNTTAEKHTGSEITKQIKSTLTENKDYKVTYKNNVNAGEAVIVITGMGVYGGKLEYTFEIRNGVYVGSTRFATLAAAFAAVPTDGTNTDVTMYSDLTAATKCYINEGQNINLDMNGCKFTSTAVSGYALNVQSDGKLSINNGTLEVPETGAFCVLDGGTAEKIDNVSITAGKQALNNSGTVSSITNSTLCGGTIAVYNTGTIGKIVSIICNGTTYGLYNAGAVTFAGTGVYSADEAKNAFYTSEIGSVGMINGSEQYAKFTKNLKVVYIAPSNTSNVKVNIYSSKAIPTELKGTDSTYFGIPSYITDNKTATGYFGTGSVICEYDSNCNLKSSKVLVLSGDIDGDSACDVIDLSIVERVTNGNAILGDVQKSAADNNSDEVVDINDYRDLVNIALKR